MQHRDEYACCQLVKGLPSDSVAQFWLEHGKPFARSWVRVPS